MTHSTSHLHLSIRKVLSSMAIACLILMLILPAPAGAQPASGPARQVSWVQQWADEFNGSGAVSGANWIYDLGTGYGCGGCPPNWGTGEIEVMTNSTNNVFQSGGSLNIRAIHTGTNPTSGWTSGRIETVRTDFQPPAGGQMAIEARIQLPTLTGAAAAGYWPAFWTLGAPFRGNYLNWPSVGEIDILENVNGLNQWWGTLHCGVSPGGPCNETTGFGGSASGFSPSLQSAYHVYRMEFDKSVSPQQMRWYVDGVQRFSLNSSQFDSTTWNNATNHGFFIILNLAIGGGFPAAFGGGPTAATASGGTMLIDYVRVFYASGGTGPTATPTRTATPSTGWLQCANQNQTCSFSGTQQVRYGANGFFSVRTATGSIACNDATFGDPLPGSAKSCQRRTAIGPGSFNLAGWTQCAAENGTCSFSGTQQVIYGANGWFSSRTATGSIGCNNASFGDPAPGAPKTCYRSGGTSPTLTPTRTSTPVAGGRDAYTTIQAESYNAQTGTQTETTSDTGGGQNVGWIANGDSLVFNNVNFGSASPVTVQTRVASGAAGGVSGLVEFRLDSATGPLIGSFSVANTGGWQSWTTIPASIGGATGVHNLYVLFKSGQPADFVNVNWFVFQR